MGCRADRVSHQLRGLLLAAATWRTSSASSPLARPSSWDVRKEGCRAKDGIVVNVNGNPHVDPESRDLFGLGTDSIRGLARHEQRMDSLRCAASRADPASAINVSLVGTAGSVTRRHRFTPDIAAICREHELWFHVDGATVRCGADAGSPASLRLERCRFGRGGST